MCNSCSKKKKHEKKCSKCEMKERQKMLCLIHTHNKLKRKPKTVPGWAISARKPGVNVLGKYVH